MFVATISAAMTSAVATQSALHAFTAAGCAGPGAAALYDSLTVTHGVQTGNLTQGYILVLLHVIKTEELLVTEAELVAGVVPLHEAVPCTEFINPVLLGCHNDCLSMWQLSTSTVQGTAGS